MFNVRRNLFASNLLRKAKGGAKKGGKKGGPMEDDMTDAMEVLTDRYVSKLPEDPLAPVAPKKISLQLSCGSLWEIRNDRIDSITMDTEEDGIVQIQKGHAQKIWRVRPGFMKIRYNEERTDKWWVAGGFCFNYYYGPVHLAMVDAYKLQDLDVSIVEKNIEKLRQNLKNKDERRRAHAQLGCEFMEPLLEALQESEFDI